jgi:AcrR family transcriptional regulator
MQHVISGMVHQRRRPVQRRSRFTYDAILEALPLLLDHRLFETCTSNQIAEVAGVGIGTFYEYFANKETVLAVWLREQYKKLIVSFDDASLEVSLRPFDEALRHVINTCFDHHAIHPGTWHQTVTLGRLISTPACIASHHQAATACWERFLQLHKPSTPLHDLEIKKLARGAHLCLQAHIEYALSIDHQLLNMQSYRNDTSQWILGHLQKTMDPNPSSFFRHSMSFS